MADAVEMVVVNGVRYRPEHAPKQEKRNTDADATEAGAAESKSRKVPNKARTAAQNK